MTYLCVLTPQEVVEKIWLAAAFLRRRLREYGVLRREIEAPRGEVGWDGEADSERECVVIRRPGFSCT